MEFYWKKLGHVYKPDGSVSWMQSHAQGGSAILWNGNIRVFFASRPAKNVTMPTFVDLSAEDPTQVLYVNPTPILDLGAPGAFDENGIIPVCPMLIDGLLHLYYIAWSRRTNTPYSLSIGLAVSEDGTTFRRKYPGPVLGVSKNDWLSVTAPGIIYHEGVYHMFYTAGLDWHFLNGRWEHTYTIRHATSINGSDWERDYINVLEPKDQYECLSSPTVQFIDGTFHMWYSYKGSVDFRGNGETYRIGYATSKDLQNWQRQDDRAGISLSDNPEAWDSRMIEYPCTFSFGEKRLMFYNGNDFGGSGFGCAELVKL
jgi:hypothetical protein